jgi:hypothetical protein
MEVSAGLVNEIGFHFQWGGRGGAGETVMKTSFNINEFDIQIREM